jgi:hypothetical protein
VSWSMGMHRASVRRSSNVVWHPQAGQRGALGRVAVIVLILMEGTSPLRQVPGKGRVPVILEDVNCCRFRLGCILGGVIPTTTGRFCLVWRAKQEVYRAGSGPPGLLGGLLASSWPLVWGGRAWGGRPVHAWGGGAWLPGAPACLPLALHSTQQEGWLVGGGCAAGARPAALATWQAGAKSLSQPRSAAASRQHNAS